MKKIWIYKQAIFIFIYDIKEFELFYEEDDIKKIKALLGNFMSFPDSLKRQLIIDTKIYYESKN